MFIKPTFVAGMAALVALGSAARADGIVVKDAYVRSSTPSSPTGAAFMLLVNTGDTDDRLVAAASDVAKRVELHSHTEDANGVMKMTRIESGIALAAGQTHALQRGGDHVMFMGLSAPLEQDSEITVTLTFEMAGEIEIQIPVDHSRKADHKMSSHGSDS